ncbi:MAG: transferrin receptor-like dimerization domain-containing protein [Candidatus Acidiferrum sp.]
MSIAVICVFAGTLVPWKSRVTADDQPLYGYSAESSRVERQWEEKLRAIPSPDNLRAYLQRLSARPHNVGSPYDKDNAEWIASKFKEFGLDTQIESFSVLYPTPKERLVELVDGGPHFAAKLQEPVVPEDPTSNQTAEQLPTYNAYSIDGDVTAPLVYVNYGLPEDYDILDRLGISVKGAIIIARYGHSWRGIKPQVGAEHGAVGCLIYSDPRDDGYAGGDVFPEGAWRPSEGVQRGSVQDSTVYMGDPLTPGVGATADAKRIPIAESKSLTKIPVLPISYADAQPLLAAITGRVAPRTWQGGLPITYHLGPGAAKVHLKMLSNWDMKPLYDVIGKVPGSTIPDEWVIRGNHHDAWVNGAEDPLSGAVAVLEEARAIGELLKQGWKPKRTIIYCAWDGEEPGLLGSTEWVETHADELRKHAVVYINSDSNGRGYFALEGSHSLEHFINDVARDVQDPETKLSAWKREQLKEIEGAKTPEALRELRSRHDLRLEMLGGGSDHAPFINFAGVASLGIGFGGEDGGGIYHSIYDDFYWYTHFSDKDFVYGRALAQAGSTSVVRMADADLLPFQFSDFADDVKMYVREVEKFADKQREEIQETNQKLAEGMYEATADPRYSWVTPKKEEVPPHLNFAPLDNAVESLERSSAEYQKALDRVSANGGAALASASVKDVNEMLIQCEHKLTTPEGLPGRFWYKHELYAPGVYTGYAAKAIPAVREGLEQKKWKEAEESAARVAKVLENEAQHISAAAAKLSAVH